MQTTVNCIYDTYANGSSSKADGIKLSDTCFETTDQILANAKNYVPVFQFNMPSLSEVNITSAKFYFYVYNAGGNVEHRVQLHNIHESLSGLTYNGLYMSKVVGSNTLESAESLVFTTADTVLEGYNRWVSFDITNMVVGHLGESYYTLSIVSDLITTPSSGAYRTTYIRSSEAGYTPYIVIDYDYATPFKPTLKYPVGDAISNTGSLTFQWQYNSGGTSPQAKYEFGWKMQSETTWNTIVNTTANTYHTMNASTFNNGIVDWRVRTYNVRGMVSEYATAQFVCIGKPANPVITGVKNDALTEITWTANKYEETAVSVQIIQNGGVIYDSGIIPGGLEDIHRPNIILDNGLYSAVLKICNIYDMWSDAVSKSFNISRSKPVVKNVTVSGQKGFNHISFSGDAQKYYIFRRENNNDFVCIAITTREFYDDYAIKSDSLYCYFIRAYNGGYADSVSVSVYSKYRGYYLSNSEKMDYNVNLLLHNQEKYIPVNKNIGNNNVLMQYVGREYPVKESSGFKNYKINVSAFLKEEEIDKLIKILNENGVFCLRNKEEVLYCDITNTTMKNIPLLNGYLIEIECQRIDFKSEVDYQ